MRPPPSGPPRHTARHRPGTLSRRASLLACAGWWWAGPSRAAGASAPEDPLVADVIDIPPWGHREANGRVGGVYADLFRQLAQRSHCPVELRLVPILRSIQDMRQDISHLTMMLDRADMNAAGIALGTVTPLPVQVWLPVGSTVRQPEQLRGHTVAVLRGPTYHEGVQQDEQIRKYPVSSPRQQLEMLRAGRVDGALGVEQNFLLAARAMNLSPADFAPPLALGNRDVRLWISPGLARHPCRDKITEALTLMRQDGSISARMERAALD